MKRVIVGIVSGTLVLGLVPWGVNQAQAAAGWTGIGNDPVFGSAYLYNAVVTTWSDPSGNTGLKEALDAVGPYDADKPYVILVGNDIAMGEVYPLTSANIVLRNTTANTVDPANHTGENPWDFNNDWLTTIGDPTLRDRVDDWRLTVSGNTRHFAVQADTDADIDLTLENVTLDGGVEPDTTTADGAGGFNLSDLTGGTFTFAGNATRCHGGNADGVVMGAGVFYAESWQGLAEDGPALHVRGGIFWDNSSALNGGVIGSGWIKYSGWWDANTLITLSGYTTMEDNQAALTGGAIAFGYGSITVSDHVVLRGNQARTGGAIFTLGGQITISGDARLTENTADAGESASADDTDFALGAGGSGGAITVAWPGPDRTGYVGSTTLTLADHASIDANTASRAGGGLAVFDTGAGDGSEITLNLAGGAITGNVVTGVTRNITDGDYGDAEESDYANIGAGGGIYTTTPVSISLPANSTTSFSGNQAPYYAFFDNAALQNTGSELHSTVPFLDGDDYVSHIKSDVPTSVLTAHGASGADYFNLYNNFDIGIDNDAQDGLYAQVDVKTVPISGSGGSPGADAGNTYIDPLQTGAQLAEVGSWLKFTPAAASHWSFQDFTLTSDPTLTAAEQTVAWTHDENVYTLTVPPVPSTLTLTFARLAVTEPSVLDFPQIVTQPASATAFANTPVVLTVDAQNADGTTAGLSYQWYSNTVDANTGGVNLGTAGQSAHLNAPIASAADTAWYYVVVTNSSGSIVSETAKVTITDRTYSATAAPNSWQFPTASYGYSQVSARTFKFTNTANQPLTDVVGEFTGANAAQQWFEVVSVTSLDHPPAVGDTMSFGTVNAGASFGVNIRPKAGLPLGTYTVSYTFTWDGAAGLVYQKEIGMSFTVERAIPVITWPKAADLAYGQTLAESTLVNASDTGGGMFSWQADATIPTVFNTGYTVVLTPGDTANYDYSGIALTRTTPVKVAQRKLTGTWSTDWRYYDGTTDQQVSFTPDNVLPGDTGVSVSADGSFASPTVGTNKPISVANITVNNPNYAPPDPPTNLSAKIVKAEVRNPGWVYLAAPANTATTFTVDLTAKLPTVPSPQLLGPVSYVVNTPTGNTSLFDGTPQLVLGSIAPWDDLLTIKVNAAPAGSAPAYIWMSAYFANCGDINFMITISITDKTPVTISGVDIDDKVYDATPADYTGTIIANPGVAQDLVTVSYESYGDNSYPSSPIPPTEPGDYTLTMAIPDDDPTYVGKAEWRFQILKRPVDVKVLDVNLDHADPLPVLGTADVTYSGFIGSDTAGTALQTLAVPSLPVTDTFTPGTWPLGFGAVAVLNADAAPHYTLNQVPGTLTINAIPPAAPDSFTATPGDGQVTLDWATGANGGYPITGYELQIDDGQWTAIPGTDSGTISYTVNWLDNGRSYAFALRAVSDAGTGAPSRVTATPKSNSAALLRVGSIWTYPIVENGTLANPEQVTIQVRNQVPQLDSATLEVAGGATGVLYTDPGFTTVGAIELTDIAPTEYHAYVVVTAQNGRKAYYDVTVTRVGSSTATLLQVAGVDVVADAYSRGALTVGNGVYEIKTSDLVAADHGRAALMDSAFANPLDRVPLSVTVDDDTKTTLYVRVYGESGSSARNYVLTVTREPLPDTRFYVGGVPVSFADPPVGDGTLHDPLRGSVSVPHNVDVLASGNIVPPDGELAALTNSDWNTEFTSQRLASNATTTIYVIAGNPDYTTRQYYQITVTRQPSADTSLLFVAGTAPTYTDDTHGSTYVRWLTSYLTNDSFQAAPGATVELLGVGTRQGLRVGDNTVRVKVTAEDGTAQSYVFVIHRQNNTTKLVSMLGYPLNLLGAGSNSGSPITATLEIDWHIGLLKHHDVVADAYYAAISSYSTTGHGDLEMDLPEGTTVVWVSLTAEDTDYFEYFKINVVRAIPTGTQITELFDTPVSVSSGDGTFGSPYLIDFAVGVDISHLSAADVRLSDGAATLVDQDLAPGAYTTVNLTVMAAAGNTAQYQLRIWRHADTSALAELVALLEHLLSGGLGQAYTPESVQQVTDALTAAKAVLQEANPPQTQVDAAKQALLDAAGKLQIAEDDADGDGSAALSMLLATVQQLTQASYTPDSWAVLAAKRDAALAVLADPARTSAQIKTASDELMAALLALKLNYVTEVRTQVAKVNVAKRKTFQLAGLAYLTSGKTQGLTYTSSNPKVAKVSASGKITGVKPGKATITATSKTVGADGAKLSVKVQVKVLKSSHKVQRVTASFTKKLKVGASVQVRPVVAKSGTPGKVTFKSSNSKIAKIDKTGKLTALKKGTVKITITAGSKKKVYTVKVRA
jgi:hypothetical protein